MESAAFHGAAADAGLKVHQCLVWSKNVFAFGRQDYQWRHEACLYGWKDGAAHHFVNDRTETTVIPTDDLQRMKKSDLIRLVEHLQAETPTSVLEEDKPVRSDLHPTMKPVKLIARLVRNSTQKGDIVLDTFGGSGTTLIACEQLGRTCRIMELDPRYADVIIKRWEEYTGEKAQLLDDEKPMEKKDHSSV